MTPSILRSLLRSACVLVSLLVMTMSFSLSAQTMPIRVRDRIVQPIDENVRVILQGYVAPEANLINDRGAAPDSMPLDQLHLVLRRSASQEAALKQLIQGQQTPGSTTYHKWLTPAEFGTRFGPSLQDLQTLEGWLSSHGFAVQGLEPGGQVLALRGNVAELRNAFGVQIHRYVVNGNIHYAAANNPQIPAALAPVVAGFVSLNNFRPHLNDRVLGTATYDAKTGRAVPNWTYGNASRGLNFVLSPGDFGVQYDLPTSPAMQGQRQSIAILGFSNINLSLVQQFRTLFGLPSANLPQVVIDGNDPGINGVNNPDGEFPGSATEAYLDVEWAGAIAPQAKIYLVIAADTALESGGILSAENAVESDLAPIISSSIDVGGCEANAGEINSFISSLWEQAAAEGITVVVAAGDNGSAGCDNENTQQYAVNGLGVSSWASTPFDVAVGGTDFYYSDYSSGAASISNYWVVNKPTQNPHTSLEKHIPEQPWNDSQYGDNAIDLYQLTDATNLVAGAGGASSAGVCSAGYSTSTGACQGAPSGYPKPSWQTGFGPGSVRDLPDVSLFAADGANYSYYPVCAADGDCQTPSGSNLWQITGVGGTSAAAPSFAAIMALVDQQYGPQGQADYVLYRLKVQHPTAFNDITVGTNSVPCMGANDCLSVANPINGEGQIGTGSTPDYNAASGYNLATGLGSVDAARLIADWGSITLHSTQTTLTLTPIGGTYTHGSPVTIEGQVTGTSGNSPGGAVAIMSDSTTSLQQALSALALSSGTFTATTYSLPGGTYNLWAQYSGDGTNGASTSPKVEITVAPEESKSEFNVVNVASATAVTEPSGSTVPYGTQLVLDDQIYGKNYATLCPGTAPICQHYNPPTGTVVFKDNINAINTAVINAEGDAEYNAVFDVGSHQVTATYLGGSSYTATTGGPIYFTVTKDKPSIIVRSPGTVSGQPGVITILVENMANSQFESTYQRYAVVPAASPTGNITIQIPNLAQPLTERIMPAVDPLTGFVDGVATVTLPSLAAGNQLIDVTYSGDNNYETVSQELTLVVAASGGLLQSTIAAIPTGSIISPDSNITVTGTVSGPSLGDPAPTGTVLLYSSGNLLAQVPVTPGSADRSAFTATLNSTQLFQGTNYITLQYTGDAHYNPSQFELNSGGINNTLSDFSMVPESENLAVAVGGISKDIIQVYSVNGFAGTVNYSCSAAAGVTCKVSQNSTPLLANGIATFDVIVGATSATPNGRYDVTVLGTDSTGEYMHSVGLTAMVTGSITTGSPSIVLSSSGSTNALIGSSGSSILTISPENGFTGQVNFGCNITGAPAGISCNAQPVSIDSISPVTSMLTVDVGGHAVPGTYMAVVAASDAATGTITSTTTVPVVVAQAFALNNSGNISLVPGASARTTLLVTPGNGFSGDLSFACSVSGSPAGLSCSAPPVNITSAGPATSTLTVSAAAAVEAGTYTAVVTATDTATQTISSSITVSIIIDPTSSSSSFALSNTGIGGIAAGGTGTSTVTVTPSNGFTGNVALSCAVSNPTAGVTCSLSDSTVNVISGAVTSTLTVATSSSSAELRWPGTWLLTGTGGTTLALMFFFGVPARARRWQALLGLLIVIVVLAGSGCGSAIGGAQPSEATYTVTVAGTAGSVRETTALTLTVFSQ